VVLNRKVAKLMLKVLWLPRAEHIEEKGRREF
jgi:hypothetical protein